MKFGLIGNGAIATYVRRSLVADGHDLGAVLLRPNRLAQADFSSDTIVITDARDFPQDIDVITECAGHGALRAHGADTLRRGLDVVTVSLGALADDALADSLRDAARAGGATLHLASGAIGALDTLQAARSGTIHSVRYISRKPPHSWAGSPAEAVLDLSAQGPTPQIHFQGSARAAALRYPKNANVAAAVALAGIGFDKTAVELISDPTVTANIHEVHATGDFGEMSFRIAGEALPDNPRSSALAAMSVVTKIAQLDQPMRF